MKKTTMSQWNELAEYLEIRSNEICADNGCTDEEHNCESYAYIAEDCTLIDICYSDFFQGWGCEDREIHGECACIPLPWQGTGEELEEAVNNDIGDMAT